MAIDHNGPSDPYAGPSDTASADEGHGSGLERTASEPKQGVGEAWSQDRPVDWNPPPGNPGSDQDSQAPRDNGTARTDEEKVRDGEGHSGEVPLPADDDAPIEEDMQDVDANNSVSSEHPQPK